MSLSSSRLSNENHSKYYFGSSPLLTKRILFKSFDGTLDFTINDTNNSEPIYVASVLWASQAYLQGMRPGDQILSVNGISFEHSINYTQALQILYSRSNLEILLRTARINALDATLYDWYDPIQQRSTSPPPGTYLSRNAQLPYFQRTVNISVEKGKRLGLVIRGGAEYGLGIFISGIDKGSLSEQSGLCVGDQILSVNGIDFRRITHRDAVHLLRNMNHISFHLRQINKLPQPRNQSIPTILRNSSSSSNRFKGFHSKEISSENDDPKHFLKEYLQEKIPIDQFSEILLELLNKQDQEYRNEIVQSIRRFIRSNDLDRFDIHILKDDLNTLKLSHDRLVQKSFSQSGISLRSSSRNLSKSVENLSNGGILRPQSLFFEEKRKESFRDFPTPLKNNISHTLRKTKSLHSVDQSEEQSFSSETSRTNLTNEQQKSLDHFLQDYSSSYPITIHKVRPTLGIAIEGGLEDRIPLPRIVYMQPDGCAYVSSGLRVGHVIIGLNGYSMKGLYHRQAALLLASAFKDKNTSQMDLVVVEPSNDHQH